MMPRRSTVDIPSDIVPEDSFGRALMGVPSDVTLPHEESGPPISPETPTPIKAGDVLFGRYKMPVLIGLGICFASLVLLATLGTLPLPLLLIVFAMIGFSTGMTSVVMSHGRSLVAPHLLGRTITLLNIGTMGGGFLVQFVSGTIINLFPTEAGAYPLEAYRVVFALQAVLVAAGFLAYWGSRESHSGR